MPEKFVDCRSKLPFERELFIVEGDSALGSCKLSRDASFQAIMPVRGKVLNCLKKELSAILNSDPIIDLIRVLGCGIEAESKYIENIPKFDINKLNYGKVIICTDADIDGMQIRCLVIGMIYRLCPTLLKAGKVFIAETPLFEITAGKKTYFAYTENEKTKILEQIESEGMNLNRVKIQRSKGLGENDPEMMSISTMAPLTRRLVPVEYPSDDSNVASYFNALLGDDIETRRILINEYFDITDVDID
jgi:DNA gyrase subunit B